MQDRWIVIPRWDDFQHYKNRDPIWIKTFVKQVRDREYMKLSFAQRGILNDLRMLYAESNGQLHEQEARRRLATSKQDSSYWRANLEALNHAGFVVFDASKPLASREQRQRHKELDDSPKPTPLIRPCPECGLKLTPMRWSEHMRNVHNLEDTA